MPELRIRAALLAAVFLFGCGAGDEPVAFIGKKALTKKQFALKAGLYSLSIKDEKEAEDFLNLLINNELILGKAARDRVKVSREEVRAEIEKFVPGYRPGEMRKMLKKGGIRYSDWLRDITEKLLIKKEIDHAMRDKIEVREEELRDYYWSNIINFRKSQKVRARQIVTATREQAEEVLYRVRMGDDFAELAKKHSATSEGKDGGDLGYFGKRDMPAFITQTVFYMKPGQVSGIVSSQYGFHIFKCEEVLQAYTPKYEEVREEVYEEFYENKKNEVFEKWMQELRKGAEIRVMKEKLGKLVNI